MKKTYFKFVALFILIGFISISLYSQAGRGRGRIKGTVVDANGKVLSGVQIKMTSKQFNRKFETKTDSKGEFAILGFANGRWQIITNIKGYLPKILDKQLSQFGNKDIRIILQKAPENQIADTSIIDKIKDAQKLYNKKKYKESLVKFKEILNENKDMFFLKINIANCYKDLGETDKAVSTFKEVIEDLKYKKETYINDLLTRAYIFLAYHYSGKKDYSKAKIYFEKVTKIYKEDEHLFYNLGELYMNENNSEGAIQAFGKACEINPKWGTPLVKLAYAYLGLGKMGKAVAMFDKYIKEFPEAKDIKDIKAMLPELRKMVPKK